MEQPDGNVNKIPKTVAVDRISNLNDDLITHILSFLPTRSAIQTSVLSKRWENLWTLVLAVDFDSVRDVPYGSDDTTKRRYLELIARTLEQRDKACEISKFKLHMEHDATGCSITKLDRWLRFALAKNVKELDLFFGNSNPYSVPCSIFCLKNLVVLKLNAVEVELERPSTLPQLKVLHLLNLGIGDHMFRNILLGCFCIEELVMRCCVGTHNPFVSSLSLKSVEVEGNERLDIELISINAPNLHSFVYKSLYSDESDECDIILRNCKKIRKLFIRGLPLDDQWFEDLKSRAPLLENLNIAYCYDFQHIRISNKHLKKFEFTSRAQLAMKTVTINAPSLVFFRFTGCPEFRVSFEFQRP